jgi:acetyl esterase
VRHTARLTIKMPGLMRALSLPIFLLMTHTVSARTPELLREVEYAQPGGLSLRFDAALPAADRPTPAAIIVHGGAWFRGDRSLNEPLLKPLSDAGIAWFSITYRLATDPFQIGVAISDVEAAVRFVKSHAAEYHIDPDRIVLIGESAGGQLAAMAALGSGISVKAVVALSAPTDLVSLARTSTFIPQVIRQQMNGTPFEKLILARLADLSPIQKVHRGMPPFLFIHGGSDAVVPIEQSRTMCERIKSVGGDCRLITVPGAGHGIRWWESSAATSEPYKREMILWLQAQLAQISATAL